MTKLADFLRDLPKNRLVPVDNWNILHVDQLADIGFGQNGSWRMDMERPKLTVIYMKGKGFVLVDVPKKTAKVFSKFIELSEYLMDYKQDWEDAPYTKTGEN